MKTLMVLGAGYPQAQLIDAAKKLGYRTVVCSTPGDWPGFARADEISYTDISDPEAVLAAARALRVDGVATCCLDTGMRALGYACEKLGLPGPGAEAAAACGDKWKMKTMLMAAGVRTARCVRLSDEAALDAALDTMTLPVVVKAVDQQGSRGVYICRSGDEARAAFHEAMALTRRDFCLVEEYIEGHELGAQAFVYRGELLFVLPHGDITYMSRTAIPIGHYVPLSAPDKVLAGAVEQSEKAVRALGLDNCAVNIDLIEREGEVYVIELTGRAGATCLAELVSIYYGLDYFSLIAAAAMGGDVTALWDAREGKAVANASRMLLSEKSGTVRRIDDRARMGPDVYDLSLIIQPGSRVEKFTTAKDRIGQVIVSGPSADACLARIDELITQIKIEVE